MHTEGRLAATISCGACFIDTQWQFSYTPAPKKGILIKLIGGTPDDVRGYCRRLIDREGRGGGFILDASTVLDDARPENVKTMIDFIKYNIL